MTSPVQSTVVLGYQNWTSSVRDNPEYLQLAQIVFAEKIFEIFRQARITMTQGTLVFRGLFILGSEMAVDFTTEMESPSFQLTQQDVENQISGIVTNMKNTGQFQNSFPGSGPVTYRLFEFVLIVKDQSTGLATTSPASLQATTKRNTSNQPSTKFIFPVCLIILLVSKL